MKILWLKPLPQDERKLDIIKTSILIPRSELDYDKFLKIATSEILSVMKDNIIDRIKIVFGDELPEYQIFVDAHEIKSDEWFIENIHASLDCILKHRALSA